jgi:hypothetical protein
MYRGGVFAGEETIYKGLEWLEKYINVGAKPHNAHAPFYLFIIIFFLP